MFFILDSILELYNDYGSYSVNYKIRFVIRHFTQRIERFTIEEYPYPNTLLIYSIPYTVLNFFVFNDTFTFQNNNINFNCIL